jgi:putative heme-binding domain-containing protein
MWNPDLTDATLLRLLIRAGFPAGETRVLALARDRRAATTTRLEMLQILGEVGQSSCVPAVCGLLDSTEPEVVQLAALTTLERFDQDGVADDLLLHYPRMSGRVRGRTADVLLSRKRWALTFLQGIDVGKYSAKDVTVEQLRRISFHQDRRLDELMHKHWGAITTGTPEEKLAEMRRLSNDLRAAPGNPLAGRGLFNKLCATCHRLFDEGNTVGPDLTHANRKDRDYLLVSIVDPSAVIRKEYLSYIIQTTDGRLLTGLIAEQTAGSITLLGAKNERTAIPRDKIESLRESPVSLMPDNLLKDLKPDELRDLFSYLQADKKTQ